MRLRTAFLWSMIFSLASAAAMGIFAVLIVGLGDTGTRVLISALLVGAFSLTCLACAVVFERGRARAIMWIGIGTSLAALAVWLVALWIDTWRWPDPWDDVSWKTGATLSTICVWAGHFGLLVILPIERRAWRIVRTATLAVTAVLAVEIILVVWAEAENEWTFKSLTVLSILASCGTVVSPILALIEMLRRRGDVLEGSSIDRRVEVSLTCPRCRATQVLRAGRSKCASCGLRIGLTIEEPRCRCGHLLYMLQSDRCPECGREIEKRDRWVRDRP